MSTKPSKSTRFSPGCVFSNVCKLNALFTGKLIQNLKIGHHYLFSTIIDYVYTDVLFKTWRCKRTHFFFNTVQFNKVGQFLYSDVMLGSTSKQN